MMTYSVLASSALSAPRPRESVDRVIPLPPRSTQLSSRLLAVVQQSVRYAQASDWETYRYEQYFGPESQTLRFKGVLVPFIWAARQALISQVGARYRQVLLIERSQWELRLLMDLNRYVEAELRYLSEFIGLKRGDLTADMFPEVLSAIFLQYRYVAKHLADITADWVGMTAARLIQMGTPILTGSGSAVTTGGRFQSQGG